MHLSPIQNLIRVCGSLTETAEMLGMWKQRVDYWRKTNSIPSKNLPVILKRCRKLGLPVTAEDLILGKRVKK